MNRYPPIEFIHDQFMVGTRAERVLHFHLEDRELRVCVFQDATYHIWSRKVGAQQNLNIGLSEATMYVLYTALKKLFETDEEGQYEAYGWFEGDYEIPWSIRQSRLERAGAMVD